MRIRFGIITTSDRAFQGIREDLTTPAVAKEIISSGWDVVRDMVIPDDLQTIKDKLMDWSKMDDLEVILTTGGTGFSPRDNTPEATKEVIERNAPGIAEVLRSRSLEQTQHAMLSRGVAGIRGKVLIINLPGSPKAAVENFSYIKQILPHAIELLRNDVDAEKHH